MSGWVDAWRAELRETDPTADRRRAQRCRVTVLVNDRERAALAALAWGHQRLSRPTLVSLQREGDDRATVSQL